MDDAVIHRLPKVILHEHLDGGLRPSTILDLADDAGYRELPAGDAPALAAWFAEAVRIGGLPGYLSTFAHTVAVLQTADAIERVAYEAVEDLASDGVVHAEFRFAPELNTEGGLGLDDVLEAALDGLRRGRRDFGLGVGLIVDGMRSGSRTTEAAEAAVRWRGSGVVGYDIAGAEAGHPPIDHIEAFDTARRGGLGITIHAGEAYGLPSISQAIRDCGADRIGHGVRIVDDIDGDLLGSLATEIRDRRIPLELCPRSNVDTGAVPSLADHPIDRLLRLGFTVTVNCDNRLMSATSPTSELSALVATFGWGIDELWRVARNAAEAVFAPDEVRRGLVEDVIAPAYTAADPRTQG
jgi:adenosine deaminase